MDTSPTLALESGLDLHKVTTTGSVLHINQDYNETESYTEPIKIKNVDIIGAPVVCFKEIEKNMVVIDNEGFVKKKIVEDGGGLPLHEGCTASIAFSGYWENEEEPFDARRADRPLEVDLKDNGLLPGLQLAVKSMLVGELSTFLISYELMYGELGVPPRIKPKANCVFYIKLIRSILTPKEGKLNFSEPNMFERVNHEVKMLYTSGVTLYKSKNMSAAIQLFRKGVYMLHGCRLANEDEEKKQEKLLIKLYINMMICYNSTKQPLKACIACNELHRLNSVWNNGKVLFNNAKSLRMIGEFDKAEIRLRKAMKLCPDNDEMKTEMELLNNLRHSCNQSKLVDADNNFKQEVDNLIDTFKKNVDMCKLTIGAGLDVDKVEYIKQACIRENLFFNKTPKDHGTNSNDADSEKKIKDSHEINYTVDKEDSRSKTDIDNDIL